MTCITFIYLLMYAMIQHLLVKSCVGVGECKLLSCVQLFGTPWTVAHQAPLSMEFSRQEYWSG